MNAARTPGSVSRKVPNSSGNTSLAADRVPDLVRHLVVAGRWRRDLPEVARRQVFDFVVIVEHDAAKTRHAEVLEQQITGKDVDRGELLQRVAVVADRAIALCRRRGLEEQVERRHASLDVQVLHHDHVAVQLDEGRRHGHQLGNELRREAGARKRNIRVLERVRHPADAIMVLDQHVFFLDLLAASCPSTPRSCRG